ncbi:uncharacterized protein PV07_04091 [Cladophialophora immunda]|uniref:Uncharacterized protein n=1 Tax=Cladophialophora immunda TaxID=569365 RepID=A0A0D2CRJ8_9EURO|nr:uncharacterized protein PV07_04091 [Cladophialophora immunda]KIW32560.1 hypothetical protein PV07_04091 [Cladophialophora immunda]
MAHAISPQDLTEKFIGQFTSKLKSTDLVTLLNSHLQQKDADSHILHIDPSVLELHLELLAYENAIKVACSFPTKLAERLAQRPGNVLNTRTQNYSSVAGHTTDQYANGGIPKTEPYYPQAPVPVQTAKPPVNGNSTKAEPYYPPAPVPVQTAKPSVNSSSTKTEPDQTYYFPVKEATKHSGSEAAKKSTPRQDSNSRNSLTHEASRSSITTATSTGTTNGSKTGPPSY